MTTQKHYFDKALDVLDWVETEGKKNDGSAYAVIGQEFLDTLFEHPDNVAAIDWAAFKNWRCYPQMLEAWTAAKMHCITRDEGMDAALIWKLSNEH